MIYFLIFTVNFVNPASLISNLAEINKSAIIGGEVVEIVSAPLQLVSAASVADANTDFDLDLESAPYFDERAPLITGGDSILQNQNPITVSTPEPKAIIQQPKTPYYAVGPYLDGYFIFPTTGYNRGRLHAYNAVDISRGDNCLYESISVFAAASGVVSATYPTESTSRYANGGYGNNIILLHPNGVRTRYAHLKNILVSEGQYVNQGSIIAFMGGYPGNVGSGNSTGCHLHFEVRDAKNPFVR